VLPFSCRATLGVQVLGLQVEIPGYLKDLLKTEKGIWQNDEAREACNSRPAYGPTQNQSRSCFSD